MSDILEELKTRRANAQVGGGEKRIAAQHAKGKLTARERVELLLDDGGQWQVQRTAWKLLSVRCCEHSGYQVCIACIGRLKFLSNNKKPG